MVQVGDPVALVLVAEAAPERCYVGWFRERGARTWRRVCTASTRAGCWQDLLARLPTLSVSGGDSLVRRAEEGEP